METKSAEVCSLSSEQMVVLEVAQRSLETRRSKKELPLDALFCFVFCSTFFKFLGSERKTALRELVRDERHRTISSCLAHVSSQRLGGNRNRCVLSFFPVKP